MFTPCDFLSLFSRSHWLITIVVIHYWPVQTHTHMRTSVTRSTRMKKETSLNRSGQPLKRPVWRQEMMMYDCSIAPYGRSTTAEDVREFVPIGETERQSSHSTSNKKNVITVYLCVNSNIDMQLIDMSSSTIVSNVRQFYTMGISCISVSCAIDCPNKIGVECEDDRRRRGKEANRSLWLHVSIFILSSWLTIFRWLIFLWLN